MKPCAPVRTRTTLAAAVAALAASAAPQRLAAARQLGSLR